MHDGWRLASKQGTLTLRPERSEDDEFLRELFVATQSSLLDHAPVDDAAKTALLDMQFRSQSASYRAGYPDARFDIVELDGRPIGRLIAAREADAVRFVDFALLPERRSAGLGTALIGALIEEAAAQGLAVRVDVLWHNEASLRLCRHLGFVQIGERPPHVALEWRASTACEAHVDFGNWNFNQARFAEAAAAYARAIALEPDHVTARNYLGQALDKLGRNEEAVSQFEAALTLKPGDPELRFHMILALKDPKLLDEAADCCRRMIAARPDFALAHNNLGAVLQAQGKLDEALQLFRRAQALKEDYVDAQVNEALLLLLRGDFAAGWEKYEWRARLPAYRQRNFAQPRWRGEALRGKTILLHADQGFGDSIQYLRYIPLVLAEGCRVILELEGPLMPLASSLEGEITVIGKGAPLPDFELHSALASLPLGFGTRPDSIPAEVPYLFPRAAAIEHWRERLGEGAGLKVGLVWAGSAQHANDHNRSIAFARLRPLLAAAPVRWLSLQTGPRAHDLVGLAPGLVTDLSEALTDFEESAACVLNLDLVITVDTALAHLAGALAKPAWVLLPFIPDWRWQLEREDSPWYPTLRLFRQPAPGEWESVVRRVAEELERFAAKR
ncbi:MAG: GNAT family N-acetyltransferase [Alphaproteobacteria bacterium]